MAASYPSSPKTFTNKVDNQDTVIASDVNLAYDEITAIETTLGSSPATSSSFSGAFVSTASNDWSTVGARITNIEKGLNTAYSNRVNTAGGSTITSPASTTTVGLTISTLGTGNLFVAGNTTINSSGNIVVIDGGTA
jgi:hypothetical protein